MNALVLWYFLVMGGANVPPVQAGPFITKDACMLTRDQVMDQFRVPASICYANDLPEQPVVKATPKVGVPKEGVVNNAAKAPKKVK